MCRSGKLTLTIKENSVLHEKWIEEYGPTMKYTSFVGVSLTMSGVKAIDSTRVDGSAVYG